MCAARLVETCRAVFSSGSILSDTAQNTIERARGILNRVFGLHDFRGFQADVIETLVQGRDALVLMPTGGGKSLCYQVPALMREGVTIVVSPLIALMADQVAGLEEVGISAAFLNSALSWPEQKDVQRRLAAGQIKLLYVAPERLVMPGTLELLSRIPIGLFAIDEAHCVSMWGHDFRPEYGTLSLLRERWPEVPRVALTATADLNTRREIAEKLLLNPREFVASFDRPNIRYRVVEKGKREDTLKALVDFIRDEHEGDTGIVYCMYRASTEEVAESLRGYGIRALVYHGGMSHEDRTANLETFLREDGVVMVATIAFGMGIDKPDVRFVAHLDMPKSIENYFQETGRAGRDGKPADAWMAYGLVDAVNQRKLMENSGADEMYARLTRAKLEAMLALAETAGCRRQMILRYFGEESGPCGNCDNCLEPPKMVEVTEDAKRLASCVWRVQQAGGVAYGPDYIIKVLQGEKTERSLLNGHDKLSTFGIGRHLSAEDWRRILRQLIARDIVRVEAHNMGGLTLGQARALFKEGEKIFVRVSKKSAGRRRVTAAADMTGEDLALFERLKSWRREKAQETGKVPWQVFTDATFEDIVRRRPVSYAQLSAVSGVGEVKLERYGKDVLGIVREFVAPGKTRA